MSINHAVFAAYTVASATALILIKLHLAPALGSLRTTPDWGHILPAASGAILYGVSVLLWFYVLTKFDLSVAYPIAVGLTLAFSALGGVIILGEILTPLRILGIAMIMAGVVAVARS